MTIPKLASYALPEANELPKNRVNWPLAPARGALLIHDMQDYFMDFWGDQSPLAQQLIGNIQRLRSYCKMQGMPVFYTAQPPHQPAAERGLLNDMWGPGVTAAQDRKSIVAELAPDAKDEVLTKWRYSAFARSPLEQRMQDLGRDELIICGVYAHIGCQATATEAFMRDIKPFFVADALADFSRERHLGALSSVANHSGRVLALEEIL